MLEKAIRKAVLPILLASLMVGAGCRITYAEEQQQTTESKVATDDTFVQAPSALLMEAGTGTVIYEKDPDTRRSPASITKIMTLILIFDALENGTLKMDDLVTTSAYAKSMGGSQVFLEEGETQDVETMIKCIVIASGNDASVAMACLLYTSTDTLEYCNPVSLEFCRGRNIAVRAMQSILRLFAPML